MPDSYPYMMSNNKIAPILSKIKTAARPQKFTHNWLKKMGFTSSNDRAIIPLFKSLGFLSDNGAPTAHYDRLRLEGEQKHVLAERIKALYDELFQINTNIHRASEQEVKDAIARVTGKEEESVKRYAATFKKLVSLADFSARDEDEVAEEEAIDNPVEETGDKIQLPPQIHGKPHFHYNIQIHLPATTEISVYHAIFKSIKENLM